VKPEWFGGEAAVTAIDEAVALARLRADLASGKAREVRKRARLSQADVARAVGVDPQTVTNWEAGRRMPRGETAIKYATLLHELENVSQEEKPWAS
jgi:DNA-binding XRE family transcriptional regulator